MDFEVILFSVVSSSLAAGGSLLKEGVSTLGHVRGRGPTDTSYRKAMTQ